jgi:hypothetical protein
MGFNPSLFLLDGASDDPTPALMWVSEDEDRLTRHLAALAAAIVEGRAPAEFAGRGVLRIDRPSFEAGLAAGEDRAFTETILGEAEQSGAVLALPSLDTLLDTPRGRGFLEDLRSAFGNGRLDQFIALMDHKGVERLRRADPRLVAFFGVDDLDEDASYVPSVLTLETDSEDLGWVVAVHCQLKAPAPALEGLQYGRKTALPGTGEALAELGVESIQTLSQPSGSQTLMISLAAGAAAAGDLVRAEQLAVAVARRLIGRPLADGEQAEATRMVCYVANRAE